LALFAPEGTTMRRWQILLFGLGLLIVLAVGVSLYSWVAGTARDEINRKQYERIRERMTAAQVEELFGRPPTRMERRLFTEYVDHFWEGRNTVVRVTFDEKGETAAWEIADSSSICADSVFSWLNLALEHFGPQRGGGRYTHSADW
jgi:hypothetical protein